MAKEYNTNREGFIGAQFRTNAIKERTAFEVRVEKNDKIDHNDTGKVITNPGVILDVQNPIARREQRRVQEQREADQILVDSYNASNAVLMDQILAFDAEAGTKSELPVKTKLAEYIKSQLDKMDKADEVQGSVMSPFDIRSLVQENAKSLLHSAPESFLALSALSLAILIFNSSPKEVRSAIKKTYDKLPVGLRRGFVLIICAGILAACGAVAPTPSPEVPNTSAPPSGETTGLPSEGSAPVTNPANSEAPATTTEDPLFNYLVNQPGLSEQTISSNPALQNDVLRQMIEEAGSIPKLCAPKAKAWSDSGVIKVQSNDISITPDGVCVARSEGGKGDQFTTSVEDGDGFLTIFKSTGEKMAGIPEGTGAMDFNNPDTGMFGTLRDADGKSTGFGISRLTHLWTNISGIQSEQAAAANPTQTAVNSEPQSAETISGIINPEIMTNLVAKAKETNTMPVLTDAQMVEFFKELNRQSGHAFIFDIPGDASNVLVNVPPDLYPNFGEKVKIAKRWEEPKDPGAQATYGDYSNTWIVPKNFFNTEEGKKISEQLKRDVWVQIIYLKDKFGQPTKQLAFFDQATNQYIPIIGSEKVDSEFWQTKITKENVGDYFQPDEKAYRIIMQGENVVMPVVLAQIPQAGLDRFLLPMPQGSVGVGGDTIDTIAILQFENERKETVLVGKLTKFIIPAKALYATFLEQGSQELIYEARNGSAFRNERYLSLKGQPILPAGIYYALVSTDLKKTDSKGSGLGASWLAEGPYCQPILGDDTLKSNEYSCGVTDLAPGPVLVKKTK